MRSLPTSTEAVVFDCDGLLVDTETCWTAAESAIFAAHGHPFGPEQKALVIGRTVEAAGEAMAQYLGRPRAGAEIAAELLERVRKELSRGASALPGAAELVRACRAAVPIAVASNTHGNCSTRHCGRPVSRTTSPTRSPPTKSAPPNPHQSSTSRHARHSARLPNAPSPSRTRPPASPRHVLPGSTSQWCRPFPEPTSTTTGWAPAWPNPNCWTGPGNCEMARSADPLRERGRHRRRRGVLRRPHQQPASPSPTLRPSGPTGPAGSGLPVSARCARCPPATAPIITEKQASPTTRHTPAHTASTATTSST